MAEMSELGGATSFELRRALASAAFALSADYESSIARFLSGNESHTSWYNTVLPLKYGNNPHQTPASICTINQQPLPFKVLNGNPGYINLLDALNAWQLVSELRAALDMPSA